MQNILFHYLLSYFMFICRSTVYWQSFIWGRTESLTQRCAREHPLFQQYRVSQIIGFLKLHFNIIPPSTSRSSRDHFRSGYPNKALYAPVRSPIQSTCPTHVLDLITGIIFGEAHNHKAPPYVVFSTPLLSRPSQAQVSSSPPCFQTSSGYVTPSVWKTKIHTHTKQQAKLHFCTSLSLYFLYQSGIQQILHRMIASIPWFQFCS